MNTIFKIALRCCFDCHCGGTCLIRENCIQTNQNCQNVKKLLAHCFLCLQHILMRYKCVVHSYLHLFTSCTAMTPSIAFIVNIKNSDCFVYISIDIALLYNWNKFVRHTSQGHLMCRKYRLCHMSQSPLTKGQNVTYLQ